MGKEKYVDPFFGAGWGVIIKPFNKKSSKRKEEREESKKPNKQKKKIKRGLSSKDTQFFPKGTPSGGSFALPEDFWKTKEKKKTHRSKAYEKDKALKLKKKLYREGKGFDSEKQLEKFLIYNWNHIKELKEYQFKDKQVGADDAGILDLLAWNEGTNSHVVIELKVGQTNDETVGQLLRYMGWMKKHQCPNTFGEKVKGIIIAQDRDEKLIYAMKIIEHLNISFYSYQVKFDKKKKTLSKFELKKRGSENNTH